MGLPARKKLRLNYDDYCLLPEDKRYELIDGDLYMTPSPFSTHQRILGRVFNILTLHVEKRKLGEVGLAPWDIILSYEDVVQPDLFFISTSRLKIITEKNVQGAPDLAIEILSKSSLKRDRILKRRLYEKFSIKEYWIIDPDKKNIELVSWVENEFKTIKIYGLNSTLESKIVKGFKLKVKSIFY